MKKRAGQAIEWNDAQIALLKREWANGKTASQIARLIGGGATSSAVIGKSHRIGLAGRASPIKRRNSAAPAAPKPVQQGPGRGAARAKWKEKFWTYKRKMVVKHGYAAKPPRSAESMAQELNCSATTVYRLAVAEGYIVPTDKRKAAKQRQRLKADPRALKRDATTAERFALREVPIAADSRNVPLADLGKGQCHFATSPHHVAPSRHRFCGAPAEPSPNDGWAPYCQHHLDIAFRKPNTADDSTPLAVAAE